MFSKVNLSNIQCNKFLPKINSKAQNKTTLPREELKKNATSYPDQSGKSFSDHTTNKS